MSDYLVPLQFFYRGWGLGGGVHTKILPVVVCPEMSSPAQSLASVIYPISESGLFCKWVFVEVALILLVDPLRLGGGGLTVPEWLATLGDAPWGGLEA